MLTSKHLRDVGLKTWHRLLFPKTGVQFPAPTWCLAVVCNPSTKSSNSLSWRSRTLHTHGRKACMQEKHHTHLKNWKKNEKKKKN